jgi:large subunit ribosomal protein L10
MKKEDKGVVIEQLKSVIADYSHLYLADIGGLDSAQTSDLRRKCFKSEVKLFVVKNSLLRRALESSEIDYSPMFDALTGETSIMLSNTGNAPAKLIKEFSKSAGKPALKAAYVEEAFYGADQLDTLAALKSKNELIGDIIGLLQSPLKNILSGLKAREDKQDVVEE